MEMFERQAVLLSVRGEHHIIIPSTTSTLLKSPIIPPLFVARARNLNMECLNLPTKDHVQNISEYIEYDKAQAQLRSPLQHLAICTTFWGVQAPQFLPAA